MIDQLVELDPRSLHRSGEIDDTAAAPRVLVIDETADAARLLGQLPARVQLAPHREAGLALAFVTPWDLFAIDLLLPHRHGFDVCRAIRAGGLSTPILMLLSGTNELDRVTSLELGADDCIDKPFNVLELQARAKALLRRSAMHAPPVEAVMRFGALTLDRRRRVASLAGKDLALAPREWKLLAFLAAHPRRAFTRTELLDHVWGQGHDGYEHTVNSHVNRLRTKLGEGRALPRYIHTVWGTGYRFEPAECT
jgi:DNA-binding response OmpR family regulator